MSSYTMVDTNHSHIIFASSLSCTLYFCIAKIAKRLACNFIFLFIAILISFLLAMSKTFPKQTRVYLSYFFFYTKYLASSFSSAGTTGRLVSYGTLLVKRRRMADSSGSKTQLITHLRSAVFCRDKNRSLHNHIDQVNTAYS